MVADGDHREEDGADKDALAHRIRHSELSWKAYILIYQKKRARLIRALLDLRTRLVRTIKRAASEFNRATRSCVPKEKLHKRMSSTCGTLRSNVYGRCGGDDVVAIPGLQRCMDATGSSAENGFLLDFGSVTPTSNADITLLDVYSLDVVRYIVRRVNEDHGRRLRFVFTQDNLHTLFDVSLYINSFVINLDGQYVYVNAAKSVRSRALQRWHARSRLRDTTQPTPSRNYSSRRRELQELLEKKRSALFARDFQRVLELTSEVAYFYEDAYRSQGAFLHVLIEIQAGVPVPLTSEDYLDSAFDNLGMLASAAQKCCSQTFVRSRKKNRNDDNFRSGDRRRRVAPQIGSAAFSKYVSRLTHALKRLTQEVGKNDDIRDTHKSDVMLACGALVRYFDAVSSVDHTKPELRCSTGSLSDELRVPNRGKAHTTFYEGVFAKKRVYQRKGCAYFSPYRCFDSRAAGDVRAFLDKTDLTLVSIAAMVAAPNV